MPTMAKRCLSASFFYDSIPFPALIRKSPSPASSLDPFRCRFRNFHSTPAAPSSTGGDYNLRDLQSAHKVEDDLTANPPPPPLSTGSKTSSSIDDTPIPPSEPSTEPQPLPPRETTVIQSPIFIRKAARAKLHEKLPRKTDFDPLRRNPWARALASPVRMCAVTHARLPAEFFGDFALVEHPATKEPWMMPVDLLGDEIWEMRLASEPETETKAGIEALEGVRDEEANKENIETNDEQAGQSNEPENAAQPIRRRGRLDPLPKLRITNHPAVLSKIAQGKSSHVTRSLIPYRWKHPHGFLTKKENDSIVWREDLPDFVLRHLRKNVVRGMKHSCIVGKDHRWSVLNINPESSLVDGLETALKSLGDLKNMKCGAVVLLKHRAGSVPDQSPVVPEVVTLPLHGTQIPVFDLPKLLSEEDLRELREHHEFFAQDAVLFRPSGDKTIYTMLGLSSLQSYVTS